MGDRLESIKKPLMTGKKKGGEKALEGEQKK